MIFTIAISGLIVLEVIGQVSSYYHNKLGRQDKCDKCFQAGYANGIDDAARQIQIDADKDNL